MAPPPANPSPPKPPKGAAARKGFAKVARGADGARSKPFESLSTGLNAGVGAGKFRGAIDAWPKARLDRPVVTRASAHRSDGRLNLKFLIFFRCAVWWSFA